MKYFLTLIIGLNLFFSEAYASEEIIVKPILPETSSAEVKKYRILYSLRSEEIMTLSARKIAKLGTWTIEFMIPNQMKDEVALDFPLAKSAMRSGVDYLLRDLSAKNVRVVRVDMQVSPDLWESFTREMKQSFAEMDGRVEPKSKIVFQRFKEFLARSTHVQKISEMLSKRLGSDVISILPGEEINFEDIVVGRRWKQLPESKFLGFRLPVTFCVIFDTEKSTPSHKKH